MEKKDLASQIQFKNILMILTQLLFLQMKSISQLALQITLAKSGMFKKDLNSQLQFKNIFQVFTQLLFLQMASISQQVRILAKSGIYKKDLNSQIKFKGHKDYFINSVAFSADSKYLAAGSSDKTCKIWNVKKEFELIKLKGHTSLIFSIAFSADGKYSPFHNKVESIISQMNSQTEFSFPQIHVIFIKGLCFIYYNII